ncbi:hypothetical protein BT69DRAFT_837985 [Atractiella rhizophila]|nr:hypothetical protein BT69DRAFT_837985 [Atractiella rhizophila]
MSRIDKYYGRRDIAILCERTVTSLFHKSKATTPFSHASTSKAQTIPALREWIAYILYRTALPNTTVFHALHLLKRLAVNFACDPTLPSPPLFHHRLIFSCLVLATDWAMDDAYSKKSWSIACRHVFSLGEINEMEVSLLRSLDWTLRLPGEDLEAIIMAMEGDAEATERVGDPCKDAGGHELSIDTIRGRDEQRWRVDRAQEIFT